MKKQEFTQRLTVENWFIIYNFFIKKTLERKYIQGT